MRTLTPSWRSLLIVVVASHGALFGQTEQPSIETRHWVGNSNSYGYTLTVFADGRVEYAGDGELSDGSHFLKGTLSYAIPEQEARELIDRCSSDWFRSLKDEYLPDPRIADVSDSPEVWLICKQDGWTKTVEEYLGSPAPDALHLFQRQVSSAAHPVTNPELMSRWIADHPDLKTPQGNMAVDLAAELSTLPVLKMLLADGATGNRPDAMDAAIRGTCEDCVTILRNAGASLNAPDTDGYTPLLVAAEDGNLRMVARLLDAGADPSLASAMWDRTDVTPLGAAVICRNSVPESLRGLLEPIELPPQWQSLFREKREDCLAVVRALIAHRANVNQANQKGETALMLAVDADSPETVELLVKAGAKSDPRDKDGCTAIDRAKGNAKILGLLRDKGPLEASPAPPR